MSMSATQHYPNDVEVFLKFGRVFWKRVSAHYQGIVNRYQAIVDKRQQRKEVERKIICKGGHNKEVLDGRALFKELRLMSDEELFAYADVYDDTATITIDDTPINIGRGRVRYFSDSWNDGSCIYVVYFIGNGTQFFYKKWMDNNYSLTHINSGTEMVKAYASNKEEFDVIMHDAIDEVYNKRGIMRDPVSGGKVQIVSSHQQGAIKKCSLDNKWCGGQPSPAMLRKMQGMTDKQLETFGGCDHHKKITFHGTEYSSIQGNVRYLDKDELCNASRTAIIPTPRKIFLYSKAINGIKYFTDIRTGNLIYKGRVRYDGSHREQFQKYVIPEIEKRYDEEGYLKPRKPSRQPTPLP